MVIIDDIRSTSCSFDWLLKLLDRNALIVPTKGGFVNWNPEVILITCPESPDKCFSNHETETTFSAIG